MKRGFKSERKCVCSGYFEMTEIFRAAHVAGTWDIEQCSMEETCIAKIQPIQLNLHWFLTLIVCLNLTHKWLFNCYWYWISIDLSIVCSLGFFFGKGNIVIDCMQEIQVFNFFGKYVIYGCSWFVQFSVLDSTVSNILARFHMINIVQVHMYCIIIIYSIIFKKWTFLYMYCIIMLLLLFFTFS